MAPPPCAPAETQPPALTQRTTPHPWSPCAPHKPRSRGGDCLSFGWHLFLSASHCFSLLFLFSLLFSLCLSLPLLSLGLFLFPSSPLPRLLLPAPLTLSASYPRPLPRPLPSPWVGWGEVQAFSPQLPLLTSLTNCSPQSAKNAGLAGKALALVLHPSSGHGRQGLLLRPAPGLYLLQPSGVVGS